MELYDLYNLYYKSFVDNNYLYIIQYFIIVLLIVLFINVIAPLYYSDIIISLNLKQISDKKFYHLIFILLGIWICVFIFDNFKQNVEKKLISEYIIDLRNNLMTSLFKSHKNNLKDIKIGNYILRIMRVSERLSEGIYVIIYLLFPTIIELLFISLFLFKININIGLFLFIGFFIYIIVIYYFLTKIIDTVSIRESFFYKNIDKLNSKLSNLTNIYLNNKKTHEIEDSKKDQQYYHELFKKNSIQVNILNSFLQLISIILFLGLIYISYYYFKKNILSKYNFILILIILTYFLNTSLKLSSVLPDFIYCIGYSKDSYNHFNKILNVNNINKKYININNWSIKINNVSFYYPLDDDNNNKKYIFKNLNLEIKSGERLAILGSSGSGKSTLVKLLMNLYNYDGTIYLDNHNIKEIDDDILRQNIIYVNQKTHLFDNTIFENIKYGNNNISNNDILKVIHKYHFNNVFKGLNNNYNTNCGVNGNNLSMGMQKIIIILRAYFKFNNSKVIIFDEPLASLDHNTRKNVLKLINDINKDKTIIIITHDTEILSIVNRKININDIKINN